MDQANFEKPNARIVPTKKEVAGLTMTYFLTRAAFIVGTWAIFLLIASGVVGIALLYIL
jgi:hypothetical protein